MRSRPFGGEERGLPRWSSLIHTDLWSADWVSLRPPPGPGLGEVRLRGRLHIDFGGLTQGWIRGRVARMYSVLACRDTPVDADDPSTWEPRWGSTMLTPIRELPVPAPHEHWPVLPNDTYRVGHLVELDLDDLPDGRTGGVRR